MRSVRPAIGIFLLVGAVYSLAGPGRIDIIDGQYRFEVAKNILEDGSIQIMDPYLGWAVQGINGVYSPYNVSGSLAGVPLIALAKLTGSATRDRQQFFFSFTSAMLGAATAAVLFLFYEALGVRRRTAIAWIMVASFATLAFPAATSVFDQTQHGFLILCAAFLAFLSARRESMTLAVAGGVCLALLVNYQEIYVVLFPGLAAAALAPPNASPASRRRSYERCAVFMFVGAMGLLVWCGINNYRFGSLLFSGKSNPAHPPAWGNPVIGVPGLLISPGKSIFLYSPATLIALLGLRRLFSREPRLGLSVVVTSVVYVGMIASLSFYGGDWCWGPRYFASVLPLLALGFPFLDPGRRAARIAVRCVIVASICVQALALSVEHHRFFFAHSLPAFFWYSDQSYYFTHSALISRPGEILDSIEHGIPAEATQFRPGPYPDLLTYAVFGGWGQRGMTSPEWMRHYRVFWLLRPWPLWMRTIPPGNRPVNPNAGLWTLLAVAVCGGVTIQLSLKSGRDSGVAGAVT
jgi:hypothetical protein